MIKWNREAVELADSVEATDAAERLSDLRDLLAASAAGQSIGAGGA